MSYKKDSVRKPVPLYLTDELKNKIDEKAVKEARSRNSLMVYALKFYLEASDNNIPVLKNNHMNF